MAASAALVSLLQILDSSLQSAARGCRISLNKAELKSLHEKVSLLLDFLDNFSPNHGKCKDPRLESLETKITLAAHKAEAVIVSAISNQLAAESKIVEENDCIANPHILLEVILLPLACLEAIAQILNYFIMLLLPISFQLFLTVCFFIVIYFPFFILLHLSHFTFTLFIVNPIVSSAIYVMHKAAAKGKSFATRYWRYIYQPKIRDLRGAVDDISFIIKEVMEIMDASGSGQGRESLQNVDSAYGLSIGTGKNTVVGLDSDLNEICGRLTRVSSQREIVSIVGMGGIGKTTLARQVHDHPYMVHHFDVRSWVAVSQEYSLPRVMLDLLASANFSDSAKTQTEMILKSHRDDDDLYQRLGDHLYRNLMGRRYLIVMDDLWDTKIWDSVMRFFPDKGNGSRVLLTTRLSQVASYANSGSPLQMQLMNDEDSWHLLCEKAFGGEGYPPELEAIGRAIARNCRGLPLAIVVVGGLLYNEHRAEGQWERVSKSLNSRLYDEQCLEILGLSYNNLPRHLKPCFLYMGAFLGATEIPATKLFNLWAAEGLLKPSKSKSLEEVAEEYLKDLIQRNLIVIGKRSCNGTIKTCRIHDLLRDICLLNARKENFLDFANQGGKNIGHGSGFRIVRVLDLELYINHGFPDEFLKSVHLRYLAFTHTHWPSPILRLWSLQTLVFHQDVPMIPAEIWLLPNLRHLYPKRGTLPDPPGCQLLCNTVLENLQTLVGVSNLRFTKGILKRIPNLKKLGISYGFHSWDSSKRYYESLANLSDLHQLETLNITVKFVFSMPVDVHPAKFAFPEKLKELSLSGCRFPWEDMTSVGALPNLQVLKLKNNAFVGGNWELVEGEFLQLKFLVIDGMDLEQWSADETHFPLLQHFILRRCRRLQEIPCGMGEIPTLERIELVDCHPCAVASAEQILEEQQSIGNEDLKIHIKNHEMRWTKSEDINLWKFEPQPEHDQVNS